MFLTGIREVGWEVNGFLGFSALSRNYSFFLRISLQLDVRCYSMLILRFFLGNLYRKRCSIRKFRTLSSFIILQSETPQEYYIKALRSGEETG